ncbi:MAG TPA: response regulator [Candidatus Xenobia bacterium]|jgi:FixJ family two-component response regulator
MSHPILVVDDEEVVRISLKDLLEGEGYRVMVASSGEEALGVVEREAVQMVITDIQMPGISGLQLQKRLRESIPCTPILVMTAFPTVERAVAALQGGAVNFITKPFDIGTVLDTVTRTLATQDQMRRNLATLQLATSKHSFDMPGTMEHVGGIIHYFCNRTILADVFLPSVTFQIRLALDELLVNAVKHGTEEDATRRVRIEATITPDKFDAVIEDEGKGFDWKRLPDPKDDVNLYEMSESGRGVFLVRCYMDEVEYSDEGRRVHVVKYNREVEEEI